jgi:hypothetical protein
MKNELREVSKIIRALERGDHATWQGDDFLRLLVVLRKVYADLQARVKK